MIIDTMTSMFAVAADGASNAIRYRDLHLDPVLFEWGWFKLRWYSLAYLAGILIGWWYLLKLINRPGAPMARRHADDMVFYATLGIILGGRLGYVLFYKPAEYFADPVQIFKLWDGGMSFHGGVIGTSLGIFYLARKNGLNWLRIHDYVACCVPFGLFFGRLANFVNHELWGRPTDVPWAVIFPEQVGDMLIDGPPRHPSQLYEAGLEGHRALSAPLVPVLANRRALLSRPPRRHLPSRLRRQPLIRRILPRARRPSRRASPK